MKWQSIETVPVNERVLVWWENGGIDIAYHNYGNVDRAWYKGSLADEHTWHVPIFWMPLPDAPPPESR